MKLIVKFNLVLLVTCALGLGCAAVVSQQLLKERARAEALQAARLMLASAMATRNYTSKNLVRLLSFQMRYNFVPESVPSFAAVEIFDAVHQQFPDYSYREALLNPMNPRDRVVEWEADVVNQFRSDSSRAEIIAERETPTGKMLFLARPIRITDPNCLGCHTTPEAAPRTLVERYGTANGFGWKLNETVGAQIISVPASVHTEHARLTFITLMASIAGVFVVVFVVLNLMLTVLVIRPVTTVATIAERLSLGQENVPDFPRARRDEVGALVQAFSRMRTSLRKAISMIEA
jgi:HAMP domain-containing protein